MQGLQGEVDGNHFWDAVDEKAVFEFSYRFPGLSEKLESRAAYMEWFAAYDNVLDWAGNLNVYKDKEKNAVILDYEVKGTSAAGKPYRNRFCSIVQIKDRKIVHWTDFADTYSAFCSMSKE
ncbi:MAG: limonene-1,2-epoxide hydrolase [Alphaproteobacteria bacterium]|nr:limonene-1,2-epoxide hydrolase [Alphaproteobacteria bacterium]